MLCLPLVVNVRNLGTGYVGPQFHDVCDDLFQPIFSSGEEGDMVDEFHNYLFESNCNPFVEDELNAEGEWIYLDKIWVNE